MYGIQRQSLILEMIEAEGEVEVTALSEKFGTSKETIRRDLREMEKSGLLTRTHGGAVSANVVVSEGYEYPLLVRGLQKYDEKQMICRSTVPLLEDGDTIFLDNSSTTMSLMKYIPTHLKITIVTNSIQIILEAGKLKNPNTVVMSLGGIFYEKNYSLTGVLAMNSANNFFPDKAIMSCRGINKHSGMTDASIYEIEVKRKMLENAKQFILMADYSKFGLTGAIHLGGLDEIDILVTDSKVDREMISILDDFNVKIIIAAEEKD